MSLGARRRYLAVPAGTYPPPAPPRAARAASAAALVDAGGYGSEPEPTLEGPALEFADDLAPAARPYAPSPAAAARPVPDDLQALDDFAPAAPSRPAAGATPPDEPDLDALLSGPVSPTFAAPADDDPGAADGVSYGDPEVRRSSRWGVAGPGRMLLGAAAGALLGLAASFALLTLLPGGGRAFDPNPVTLWQNAEPRMHLMVWLVTVGFALLGAAFFGARGGGSRRSS